jgi:hypothetical protein
VFSIEVGDNKDQVEFSFNFKLENMKMLDGDYHVALSKSVIGQFTHASRSLTYWVAMDASSTYKG